MSRRQYFALAFVAILSPLVRREPRDCLMLAGGDGWLSPILAAAVIFALMLLTRALFAKCAPDEGLDALTLRVFGGTLGRALLAAWTLWFVFYAGFLLRSGADRFVSTVYQSGSPELFEIVMLAACVPAALGTLKALGRSAMIFRPVMAAVFALVLVFSLSELSFGGELAPTAQTLPRAAAGSAGIINAASVAAYLCFVEGKTEGKPPVGAALGWTLSAAAAAEVMFVCVFGMFGPRLGSAFNYPFFILVRAVTLFGSIERIEAVVIALWVFSDFTLISLLLYFCLGNLRRIFGITESGTLPKALSMKNGRWLVLLCAAAALAVSLVIAPTSLSLTFYSDTLVPAINSAFVFGTVPITLIIGKLRHII